MIAATLALIAASATAQVPERCRAYQRQITTEAHTVFGLSAPVATLAAQIHQESGCRATAISPVGAQGLAQFMPSTAKDMARLYPSQLGPADPTNPAWAIKAQARYMRDLTRSTQGRTECDTWAFGLAAYNGGLGWVRRDQAACRGVAISDDRCGPCDPAQWFGHVAMTPDPRRAPANIRENRGYPKRILFDLSPRYVTAGYGRGVICTWIAP